METFSEILKRETIFSDRNVLSSHYIPSTLPHRENEIGMVMRGISPALKGERPQNMFIYGGTGTGKTCCVRHVAAKFGEHGTASRICYVNCRMHSTRYRVIQKLAKDMFSEIDSAGFGFSILYEKIMGELAGKGMYLIAILDEVDMVKDLDDLLYTLTRANDELPKGGISMIGIANHLAFKERLDPRSRSSLCESEIVFPNYTSTQLQAIIGQRVKMGFKPGCVDDAAINLCAAITAQESGDARYALKLMLKAGEIADAGGLKRISDREVEDARRSVSRDIAFEAIAVLPSQQQLALLAIANLTLDRGKNTRLVEGADEASEGFLALGEAHEEYCKVARRYRKAARSARWYREYISDLEMLGLIATLERGTGGRSRARLVKIGHSAADVKKIIEKNLAITEGGKN